MSANGFHRDLGSRAVQAGRPAGANPRDGQRYTALRAQMDRLTDIHAAAPVDWQAVTQIASGILGDEGKDLSVGVWLATALFHTRQLPGLADGIHVLRDLVTTYWDDMSPPAARLRGRRNQMQWFLDQLNDELQHVDESFSALPEGVSHALLDDWDALDTVWREHDDDAPAFYGLRAMLARLPVENEATDAEPEKSNGPTRGAESDGGPTHNERNGIDSVDSPEDGKHPAITSPGNAMQAATLPPVPFVSVPTSSGADPDALADSALAALRPLIDWYLTEHPALPLLFRLNRICAWATLEHVPPAQDGLTRLPAPPDQVVQGYEQIVQTGEAQAIVHFAESRLITLRYWLDLNHASYLALHRLDAHDAADTVAFETGRLLARLPGLGELKFSDGRPFAAPDTQTWLQALAPATRRAADAQHDDATDGDALSQVIQAAQSDAAHGGLASALGALQAALQGTRGRRNHFRLRLAQCALLQRFDARVDMRPLVTPLIDELDRHRLCSWEPDLASQALQLAAAAELRGDAPETHSMLARLASLDLRAAWQLSQSTATA